MPRTPLGPSLIATSGTPGSSTVCQTSRPRSRATFCSSVSAPSTASMSIVPMRDTLPPTSRAGERRRALKRPLRKWTPTITAARAPGRPDPSSATQPRWARSPSPSDAVRAHPSPLSTEPASRRATPAPRRPDPRARPCERQRTEAKGQRAPASGTLGPFAAHARSHPAAASASEPAGRARPKADHRAPERQRARRTGSAAGRPSKHGERQRARRTGSAEGRPFSPAG